MQSKRKMRLSSAESLPHVVGTISDLQSLRSLVLSSELPSCDLLEVRLDQTGSYEEALNLAGKIDSTLIPVIVTLRDQSEGGKWTGPDEHRLPILQKALDQVSGVDIEFQSSIAPQVGSLARQLGKECIISFHDFVKTPAGPQLVKIAEAAQSMGTIVKITTMINSPADEQTLRALFDLRLQAPLCVIGMGPMGTPTRLEYPLLGSRLTYGYLDRPAAPGQVAALELVETLKRNLPEYAQEFSHKRAAAVSL